MKERLHKPEALMSALELNALADDYMQRLSFDKAHHYLTLSLQKEKSAVTCRALGIVSSHMKNSDKAMEFFEEALAIDETDTETICAIGDAYCLANDAAQAMGFYMLAIQMAPDVFRYKEKFSCLAQYAAIKTQNEAAEKIIINCLKTPGLDCTGLMKMWTTGFLSKPSFQPLLPSDQNGRISFDRRKVEALADLSAFLDPYFVFGLRKLIIANTDFEELMTVLRRRLLDKLDTAAAAPDMAEDQIFTLAEAMANYCFFTEYVFNCSPDEEEKVRKLAARLEAAPDIKSMKASLAVYGCYAPLFHLKNHETIFEVFRADPLMKDIVESQIHDFDRLQRNAANIKSITPIENAVSGKVREQYEEFPYPRWQYLRSVSVLEDDFLQPLALQKKLPVLVAGCGTGMEVSWIARLLPQAEILAVDLSRASLAYAESKAKKFKLDNITFRQADILQLGSIGRKFDFISCGGVLHHMEDPVRGWRVLTDILNPNGMMRIALYSEKARTALVEAMKIIKEKNYPSTAEGIRIFRKEAPDILPPDIYGQVTKSLDYFSLSMCRDLLFHVQEHRFTAPGIRKVLDQLGLTFRKMGVNGAVMAEYNSLYPDDPERINLDHWNAFEEAHPDTFVAMYQFWCQKTAA